MHGNERRASAKRSRGRRAALALCALLIAGGCELDASGDEDAVSEGSGASQPGEGADGGLPGLLDGGLSNRSRAIITPFLQHAAGLPPAIIIPPGISLASCGNGALDAGELCEPALSPCCADDCLGFAPAGVVCREANGACDAAELCSGEDAACPDDRVAGATVTCREADGACDVPEHCDGTTRDCPPDAVADSARTCRSAQGACDVAERCDGSSKQCPDDGFAIELVCRPANAGSPCDAPESCDGSGPDCPPDGFLQGTVCRAAASGGCDVAETCAGDSPACPADGFKADKTACNGGLGQCSMGTCCPASTSATAPRGLCSLASGDNIVFVTSGDTVASIGLSGADAPCNSTARGANLNGSFHAWLSAGPGASRAGENAASRIDEGPYARVDGTVVANSAADLTSGRGLLSALNQSEWGQTRDTTVWTGTTATGAGAYDVNGIPYMCGDWAVGDQSALGEVGLSVTNKPNWTADSTRTCDEQHALYCFADDPPAAGRVFVTSFDTYLGDGLFGLASGDRFCNDLAAQAKLKGTFVAWMSDDTTDARSRIPDRAYQLLDGTKVADSLADLTDGSLDHAIDQDEHGVALDFDASVPQVWTGTGPDGRALLHCGNWSPNIEINDGTIGDAASSTGSWTSLPDQVALCSGSGRLYCFQVK